MSNEIFEKALNDRLHSLSTSRKTPIRGLRAYIPQEAYLRVEALKAYVNRVTPFVRTLWENGLPVTNQMIWTFARDCNALEKAIKDHARKVFANTSPDIERTALEYYQAMTKNFKPKDFALDKVSANDLWFYTAVTSNGKLEMFGEKMLDELKNTIPPVNTTIRGLTDKTTIRGLNEKSNEGTLETATLKLLSMGNVDEQ